MPDLNNDQANDTNVNDLADEAQQNQNDQNDQSNNQNVTLTQEQYNSLLDRIEELEIPNDSKVDDIDYLTKDLDDQEPKPQQQNQPQSQSQSQNIDWDNMSNQQLASLVTKTILDQVQPMAQNITQQIEAIQVAREIDNAKSQFEDFDLYKDEVMQIAIKNPSLSIEKAYKLAKADNPKKSEGEKEGGVRKTKTEKLLNLPSRGSLGDKPNVASGTTKESKVVSLKDAANEAWEAMEGNK